LSGSIKCGSVKRPMKTTETEIVPAIAKKKTDPHISPLIEILKN
jgi:hypothetical protein